MTTATETTQPTPNLLMTEITVELQGPAWISTKEDVERISRGTGQPMLRFTWESQGAIEAWLGIYRLDVATNRTRLTHPLYRNPAMAEDDVRYCCHLMARILETATEAAEMLVIRVQAVTAAGPEPAGSAAGSEPESNVLASTVSFAGERFPVWHRLTPNRDTTARDLFGFGFDYEATAAINTEGNPSGEFMADVALTLMDEMDQRTSRVTGAGYQGQVDEQGPRALLADPEFFSVMMRIFPESGHENRRNILNTVARALSDGHLGAPDGTLEPTTLGELMRLSQGYEQLLTGDPGATGTEDLDQRSMELLGQIRRHNWPSEDDASETR